MENVVEMNNEFRDFLLKQFTLVDNMQPGKERDTEIDSLARMWEALENANGRLDERQIKVMKVEYEERKALLEMQFKEKELAWKQSEATIKHQDQAWEQEFKLKDFDLRDRQFQYQMSKDERDRETEREKFALKREDNALKEKELALHKASSILDCVGKVAVGAFGFAAAILSFCGTRDTNRAKIEQTRIVSGVENEGNIISGQKTKYLN